MFVFSNGGLYPYANALIGTVIVKNSLEIADMWIAERSKRGDMVVTADILLASKCVANGALRLSTMDKL